MRLKQRRGHIVNDVTLAIVHAVFSRMRADIKSTSADAGKVDDHAAASAQVQKGASGTPQRANTSHLGTDSRQVRIGNHPAPVIRPVGGYDVGRQPERFAMGFIVLGLRCFWVPGTAWDQIPFTAKRTQVDGLDAMHKSIARECSQLCECVTQR